MAKDGSLNRGPKLFQYRETVNFMLYGDSQKDDSSGGVLKPKDQLAKILVAGDHHAAFRNGDPQDFGIACSRRKRKGLQNVVPRSLEEADDQAADVRIDEDLHGQLCRGD